MTAARNARHHLVDRAPRASNDTILPSQPADLLASCCTRAERARSTARSGTINTSNSKANITDPS